MRPFSPQYVRSINRSLQSTARSQLQLQSQRHKTTFARMSTATETGELRIENTNINTSPDVDLREHSKTIVGSVLDLFAGRPSLAKLQLWKDDAVFSDPITQAQGRAEYEPQWYGLQTAFEEIERLSHEVTSAGNPIEMNLKQRYKVKGVGKEQTIDSKVLIYMDGDKISKVEDKWDGQLPDSSIKNVSFCRLFSPFWWAYYVEGWLFWSWSFVWETSVWRAFRRLNAVSVPKMVGVPKNAEEDRAKGN